MDAVKYLTEIIGSDEFKARLANDLPTTIHPNRFISAAITTLSADSKLMSEIAANQTTRASLFVALQKCAGDGMLPDGKEAYLSAVKKNFGTRDAPNYQVVVQYLIMVQGLIKSIYNSGKVSAINTNVVYANDVFEYDMGIDGKLSHKPALGNRGEMIAAYAEAKLKDGSIMREVMSKDEVEAVRNVSKSKDSGPWASSFKGEMWRKSALRRLSKVLPRAADPKLDRIIDSDDEDIDLSQIQNSHTPTVQKTEDGEALVPPNNGMPKGLSQIVSKDESTEQEPF
jgi:recombination protein RecT